MIEPMDYNDADIKKIIVETKKFTVPVFDENEAWLNISKQTSGTKSAKLNARKFIKYAAVIFFGLIMGIAISKVDFLNKNDKYVEINASKGQKIDISLPDGNKIWINSNSSLRYPANFEGFNKKIYVEGEMYFEFSETNLSPIFVIINNVVIQGFNSAFNIKTSANNQSAEITVTKGWITVNNPEVNLSDISVEEGYTCFFSNDLPLFIQESNDANFLAWKTGKLHFNQLPLKSVAAVLSDFYEIPVEIDGRVGYCNFSSDYDNADINTILRDIKKALKPTINIENSRIVIKGDDC